MPTLVMPFRLPTPGVPKIAPPPREGTVDVGGNRKLGYAEYGDLDGKLVIWFHGTPGARRQIAPVGRKAAGDLGIHLVCVERPGIGDSTDHLYGCMRDVATDAAKLADHLGYDEFATVGLSGGGPYALACAAALPDRVRAVGVLGGVCPAAGPDALPGGLVSLAARFNTLLGPLRVPMGSALWGAMQLIMPLAHPAYHQFARLMPEGDRRVFADPGIEAMFIDDLVTASRTQFRALANDTVLFGRDWGFRLADVEAPVRWWHGDADNFVALEHAEHAVSLLPNAELFLRPGESHLGGFAVADEVLATLLPHL